MTDKQAQLIVDALEAGATTDEAVALAGVTRKELEARWIKGGEDADSYTDSPEATFYIAARGAIARWRVSLRAKAAASADAGHRSAADHLRLLDEAANRQAEIAQDPRAEVLEANRRLAEQIARDPAASDLARQLLQRLAGRGPEGMVAA